MDDIERHVEYLINIRQFNKEIMSETSELYYRLISTIISRLESIRIRVNNIIKTIDNDPDNYVTPLIIRSDDVAPGSW